MADSLPPYDIRLRVTGLVHHLLDLYPPLHELDDPSRHIWKQMWGAVSSSGAHLEEADGTGTQRHYVSLMRGALREMREGYYWMRVLIRGRKARFERVAPFNDEANQIVAILTAIVRRAEARGPGS